MEGFVQSLGIYLESCLVCIQVVFRSGILSFEQACIKLSKPVVEIQPEHLGVSAAEDILCKER